MKKNPIWSVFLIHFFQGHPCSSDNECSVGTYCHSPQHAPSRCLTCRRRKKRCHRDSMCCPGNRCSNCTFLDWSQIHTVSQCLHTNTEKVTKDVFCLSLDICIPISERVLSSHKSPMEEHNKLSLKDKGWRRNGKPHAKISIKGEILTKWITTIREKLFRSAGLERA